MIEYPYDTFAASQLERHWSDNCYQVGDIAIAELRQNVGLCKKFLKERVIRQNISQSFGNLLNTLYVRVCR